MKVQKLPYGVPFSFFMPCTFFKKILYILITRGKNRKKEEGRRKRERERSTIPLRAIALASLLLSRARTYKQIYSTFLLFDSTLQICSYVSDEGEFTKSHFFFLRFFFSFFFFPFTVTYNVRRWNLRHIHNDLGKKKSNSNRKRYTDHRAKVKKKRE